MAVFRVVAPCSLVEVTDVSEVLVASMNRVMTAHNNYSEGSHLHTRSRKNLKRHKTNDASLRVRRVHLSLWSFHDAMSITYATKHR
jgi:hypothetical protein